MSIATLGIVWLLMGAAVAQAPPGPLNAGGEGQAVTSTSKTDEEADWRRRPLGPAPSPDGDDPQGDGSKVGTAPDGAARGYVDGPDHEAAEDAALFVPRLILGVPRVLVSAASAPFRGLAYLVGRYHLVERTRDLLYNDERTAAIIPTATFLSRQGFTFGARAFHKGLGDHDEEIALSARFGGRYAMGYEVELDAPRVAGSDFLLESVTRFEIHPRQRFFGYGNEAPDEIPASPAPPRAVNTETALRQRRALGVLRFGHRFLDMLALSAMGIANRRDFGGSDAADEPSIEQVYDTSRIRGFDDGYTLVEGLVDLRLDTRAPRGRPNRGVYARAFAGGVPPQSDWAFAHFGAEVSGFIDLYGGDRVLVLRAVHESVVGDDARIPFADLPRLGGPRRLRGYDLNRFRDKHTVVGTVEYRWPVHEYVQAIGFVDVGGVGDRYERMLDPGALQLGGGGGFLIANEDSRFFAFEVAYGDGIQVLLTSEPLLAFEDRSEQL